MKCLYRERVYICGEFMETHIYPVFAKASNTRRARFKPTSETQALLNQRNSEMYYTRLANTNFTSDDYKLELTYNNEHLPKDDDEADRNVYNFIRRYKRLAKKAGVNEVKYFSKIETSRYHHHVMITGGVSPKKIAALWAPFGQVRRIAPLMFDETGIAGISYYFIKDKQRYRRIHVSKNMKKPELIERTGRLSQKKVAKLAANTNDYKAYSELYNGYRLAEPPRVVNNLFVQREYIVARYYRTDANIYTNKPAYKRRSKTKEDLSDCNRTIEDSLFGVDRDNGIYT